ncbi:DUF2298 domain-containing protein [Ktedonospora formicarum]|uniref:Chlor_Arch_YYY domain-containing protein n=1 Tax=Ktedonospora formicarum TaxID=2778364 RepID=A0A8J3HSI9_9CHLR|nr:DUF2298 domain-containing protein [Ktedonospora formicarum]GHO42884.1 hypothetical protein KSX_10470 [Ktedonospora formicarum]
MIDLLAMIIVVELLGLACLPLTTTVFRNLPDRGWAFSKGLAVAVLTFGAWFPLMVLRFLPFTQGFLVGVVLLLLACNVPGFVRMRHTLTQLIKTQWRYIVVSEIVFVGMVLLLGYIRSYGPNIYSFEMFMDGGFLASIMRSEHLPPRDVWYAGYAINYYYYGHFTVAVLAKLLGQTASIAFNTGFCLLFGLCASNLFGVTSNIVAWAKVLRLRKSAELSGEDTSQIVPPLWQAVPYGGASLLFGLILGNMAATWQWWKDSRAGTLYDWFAPSRVINKTIDEFPAFSYLLSDFHAHVLTYSFTFLAIGMALNLLFASAEKGLDLFGRGWGRILTIVVIALVLGSLFIMNGWDYPTYMGLTIVCIALQQWLAHEKRWSWVLVADVFVGAGILIALSFLLFLPFYFNFVSPSQGIGIVPVGERSPLEQELLIFGLFAFVFLSLLACSLYRVIGQRVAQQGMNEPTRDWRPLWIVLGGILAIWLLAVLIVVDLRTFLIAIMLVAVAVYLIVKLVEDRAYAFTLLLGALALLLIAGCEVVYLRDVFADSYPRMNSVFKFYFQAWGLLAIASGAGLFFIVEIFARQVKQGQGTSWMFIGAKYVWSLGLLALIMAGLAYPLSAPYARYVQNQPLTGQRYLQNTFSLDGLEYLKNSTDPGERGDYEAIRWINTHISGTPGIIEAIGDDYSRYARVSALTGLPTPMGWIGHEYQWRVNWLRNPVNSADFQRRQNDVSSIYTTADAAQIKELMNHYQAEYLYVGDLERTAYGNADLTRFRNFMQVVYQADGVTIYKVK